MRKSSRDPLNDSAAKTEPAPKAERRGDDDECLCFQDVMESFQRKALSNAEDNEADNEVAAQVFFELANAPMVSYRIVVGRHKKSSETTTMIRIRQDHQDACGQHTGGIVWETSFLLINYLRQKHFIVPNDNNNNTSTPTTTKYPCGKTVVEVGAGCGLLGLGIYHSHLAKRVILTETDSVLPNLQRNVERNLAPDSSSSSSSTTKDKIRACALDWTRYEEDCERAHIKAHSVDMIVGTDVVFSTRFVRPLLETLRYLAHSETTILLCLQERCAESHRLLLESAKEHGLMIEDISEQVANTPTCAWGRDLECCVLQLRVTSADKETSSSPNESASNKRRRI